MLSSRKMQGVSCGSQLCAAVLGLGSLVGVSLGQGLSPSSFWPGQVAQEDRFFVQAKTDISVAGLSDFHASQGCKVLRTFDRFRGLQLIGVPRNQSVAGLVAAYRTSGL